MNQTFPSPPTVPEGDEAVEAVLVAHLRRQILAGLLSPGTKLGEEALCAILGVNRSRVRRVLQILAFDRLVELKANRGAFIATPGIREARDVFEARRTIERVTTEIVARTIQTPQLGRLRAIAREEAAGGLHDRQEAIRMLGEFHQHLCRQAHNETLGRILDTLILRTALIVAMFGTSPAVMDMHSHHLRIVELIEEGRSQKAAAAMERCLYALEATLDLRERPRREVDLKSVLGRFGSTG